MQPVTSRLRGNAPLASSLPQPLRCYIAGAPQEDTQAKHETRTHQPLLTREQRTQVRLAKMGNLDSNQG